MVLLVHMASVRGHTWTQVLAWLGAGHLKWLHSFRSADFIWVPTASRGWLGPSLPHGLPEFIYMAAMQSGQRVKKGSCLNVWVPDCCFGTFIPSKHLTIKESRKQTRFLWEVMVPDAAKNPQRPSAANEFLSSDAFISKWAFLLPEIDKSLVIFRNMWHIDL